MGEHEHKGLGVKLVIPEITQGMLEAFLEATRRRLDEKGVNSLGVLPAGRTDGLMVRAAIEAGMITSPAMTVEDVDTLSPKVVHWMAGKIDQEYGEATVVPPE